MSLPLAVRAALAIVLAATFASAADKPAPTYLKGSVQGWDIRNDTTYSGNGGSVRHAKVYELKGTDFIYKIDYCGAFQAGKFDIGQTVEYRINGPRLYIRHDGNQEYKCKIEGTRAAGPVPATP